MRVKVELEVDGVQYHLVPHPENLLAAADLKPSREEDFVLATVLSISLGTTYDEQCLNDFLHNRLANDDVWQSAFLRNLCIFSSEPLTIEPNLDSSLRARGVQKIWSRQGESEPLPPSGPYVYGMSRTWQPWRIYDDYAQTMMITYCPSGLDNVSHLEEYSSAYKIGGTRAVVPSRAYFTKSEQQPLAGLRFAIKDMFDVQGSKTSLGSRAYAQYHEPATKTATCIQRLLHLGAVLIGKTKLATMIIRELPSENVDFGAPWNVRGDGYLTPGESSSGSGAAIVAYPWLDMTVASDTCGSSRVPAYFNGCHGIRFSTEALPRDGMRGFFPMYDAPAMYSRDITSLGDISRFWLQPSSGPTTTGFNAVVVPTEYIEKLEAQPRAYVLAVADGVAKALGRKVSQNSLVELWNKERPDPGSHSPIEEWLEEVASVPYFYDACQQYDEFHRQYKERFGRLPYINGEMRWRLARFKQYTQQDRDHLMERLLLYKSWLLSRVFDAGSHDTVGNVMVVPVDSGLPTYRDQIPGKKKLFAGFDAMNVSPIIGGPEVTVIPGELPYDSRISGRVEHMPFAVSIIGSPGCDIALCDLAAAAMQHAQMPEQLATECSIYAEA